MADARVALLAAVATLAASVAVPDAARAQAPATPPAPAAAPPSAKPPAVTPPAVTPPAVTTDEATERYVKESARQDRVAIETSRLVLERSGRNAVREAAKKVLDERMKSQHRLTTVASVQSLGMRPDKAAADAGDEAVEALRNTAPEGLDRAYLRIAIENHEAALKLQETYGRDGENEALRSHAMAAAILLEGRIADLRRLAKELDGA